MQVENWPCTAADTGTNRVVRTGVVEAGDSPSACTVIKEVTPSVNGFDA